MPKPAKAPGSGTGEVQRAQPHPAVKAVPPGSLFQMYFWNQEVSATAAE